MKCVREVMETIAAWATLCWILWLLLVGVARGADLPMILFCPHGIARGSVTEIDGVEVDRDSCSACDSLEAKAPGWIVIADSTWWTEHVIQLPPEPNVKFVVPDSLNGNGILWSLVRIDSLAAEVESLKVQAGRSGMRGLAEATARQTDVRLGNLHPTLFPQYLLVHERWDDGKLYARDTLRLGILDSLASEVETLKLRADIVVQALVHADSSYQLLLKRMEVLDARVREAVPPRWDPAEVPGGRKM